MVSRVGAVTFAAAVAASSAAEEPRLLKDVNPGPSGSFAHSFVRLGSLVVFGARSSSAGGQELWKTDGTSAGTAAVVPASVVRDPYCLASIAGVVYFRGSTPAGDAELWVSDGTAAGTRTVKDINPLGSSFPCGFVQMNGTVYFLAEDGSHGLELWKTDGTAGGTAMVKDISPGPLDGPVWGNLVVLGAQMFFIAHDGVHGQELWKSDGTAAGTALVKDIGGMFGNPPGRLTPANDILFFAADDGISGYELWRSDGTEAGTLLVKDIIPGRDSSIPGAPSDGPDWLGVAFQGRLFLSTFSGLYASDGTAAGTVQIRGGRDIDASSMFAIGGALLYAYEADELWRTDGTPGGTVLVKDFYPGRIGTNNLLRSFAAFGGLLYFAASDGSLQHGFELWRSDGSSAGTVLVMDIAPGTQSSEPYALKAAGSRLFLDADDGVSGKEPWVLAAGGPLEFFILDPCRIVDTREPDGPLAGPPLAAGASRTFPLAGACGVPPGARAVAVNVAVSGASAAGHLRVFPGQTAPLTAAINYGAGQTRTNNAILALSPEGAVTVLCMQGTGTVDFILDVNGYFR
jgi:ELWxxDGT repeat protein